MCIVCVHYIEFVHLSCAVENSVEDFAFLIFSNCCYDLNDCLMALSLVVFEENLDYFKKYFKICIFDI